MNYYESTMRKLSKTNETHDRLRSTQEHLKQFRPAGQSHRHHVNNFLRHKLRINESITKTIISRSVDFRYYKKIEFTYERSGEGSRVRAGRRLRGQELYYGFKGMVQGS